MVKNKYFKEKYHRSAIHLSFICEVVELEDDLKQKYKQYHRIGLINILMEMNKLAFMRNSLDG